MIAVSEKYEIIQWIEKLNDQAVFDDIIKLKNRSTSSNWWGEISSSERKSIEAGIKDLENGQLHSHSDIKQLYEKWI